MVRLNVIPHDDSVSVFVYFDETVKDTDRLKQLKDDLKADKVYISRYTSSIELVYNVDTENDNEPIVKKIMYDVDLVKQTLHNMFYKAKCIASMVKYYYNIPEQDYCPITKSTCTPKCRMYDIASGKCRLFDIVVYD